MSINETYLSNVKSEACSIAQSLLVADEGYIDKVGRMWILGQEIHGEVWGTEFHVFGVAASDTDHLPTEKVRSLYAPEALRRADRELAEYIESSRDEIEQGCRRILEKYGST